MTDERVNELLKDLEAELALQPSPEFAARVRARVNREGRSWLSGWALALCGAAVAVVIVAVVAGTMRKAPTTVTVPPASSDVARADAPAPVPPRVAARPAVVSGRPVRRPIDTLARAGDAALDREILVPPDQATAVRRLLGAMKRRALALPAGGALIDEETGELIPLAIPALAIEPLPGSPESGTDRRDDR